MLPEQTVREFDPDTRLSQLVLLNLVRDLRTSPQNRQKIESGRALVLVVFPDEEGELPVIIIAAKDMETSEKVSTGRIFLTWRTTCYAVKECEFYVPAQRLHREVIEDGGVLLYADLETAKYDGENIHGRSLPLGDFRYLIEVGISLGPSASRIYLDTEATASARNKPLRFLRFDVLL